MDKLQKLNDVVGGSLIAASQDYQSENIGQEAKVNYPDIVNSNAAVTKAG
jgi:hypothetical protein